MTQSLEELLTSKIVEHDTNKQADCAVARDVLVVFSTPVPKVEGGGECVSCSVRWIRTACHLPPDTPLTLLVKVSRTKSMEIQGTEQQFRHLGMGGRERGSESCLITKQRSYSLELRSYSSRLSLLHRLTRNELTN
jgi:hypothetical protein